jgi:hypothetical protein
MPNLAVEAAVPDHAPDPVVVTEADVAGRGVGVAHAPSLEEHLAFVGPVVAVGVAQEQGLAALDHDQAPVDAAESGRDGELVGEDRELVGLAVTVGVLADLDPVAPLAGFLQFVRVVDRLGDPEPSPLVEGHADRLEDLGVGRPEVGLESLAQDDAFGRFGRRQRLLHPGDLLAFGAPALPGQVVGHRVR